MERPKHWTIEALDPYDPTGEQTREIFIDQQLVEQMTRTGPAARYNRIRLIVEVVKCPTCVLLGWNREGFDDATVYVGQPARDYPADGIDVPRPKGMVFLVFVTGSGRITEWRWERSAADDPHLPENWRSRFKRVLWPTNPKR